MKNGLRNVSARPKRRWHQFSLLTILILMGVGPIFLTFFYFAVINARSARQPKPDPEFMTLEEIFKKADRGP